MFFNTFLAILHIYLRILDFFSNFAAQNGMINHYTPIYEGKLFGVASYRAH